MGQVPDSVPERYRSKIKEAERLYEAACSFEESGRVPVMVDVGGPFLCGLLGYTFKDYYRSLETARRVKLDGLKWAYEVLGDDRFGYSVGLDMGAISEGIVFECPIRLPDEERPWLSPWIIPKLKKPEDIEKLEIPDPMEVQERFEKHTYRQYGKRVQFEGMSIHPPLSAAGSLMGTDRLYTYLYKYPALMHRLLRKLLKTYFALVDYVDELRGEERESIGLCDDHAGFLSEKMYREFVLPYNKRIYERYGKKRRALHMDSSCDHIAHILVAELKIDQMDVSVSTDLAKVKLVFDGKTVMRGNIDGRLLVPGTNLEKIEKAVVHCMRTAAPGGGYVFDTGGEGVYPGVDPERLLYMVRYAKKVGKYPIRGDRNSL